jgi:hypothetical protein
LTLVLLVHKITHPDVVTSPQNREMVDMFKPDYVAPIVGFLSSADCVDSGTVYEVFAGWAAQVRWERTGG